MTVSSLRRSLSTLALAALASLPSATEVSAAQAGSASAPAAAPAARPVAASENAGFRRQLAEAITRIALVDLRSNRESGVPDYFIAAVLLREAHRIAPDDAEVLRLAIDAATQAGDNEMVADLTRTLVRLDPTDTVAQLRLVTAVVSRQQSVEGRLNALDTLLGDRARSIDPAVRSRLALDAALLHRERGNARGFIDRLREAVRLDGTNKDAAALAAAFFAQSIDDPSGRFELLLALLRADPLDSETHLQIARFLASSGAHQGSSRFFANAMALQRRAGGLDTGVEAESFLQQWISKGPASVVTTLTDRVNSARADAQRTLDRAAAAGLPADDLTKPADILLAQELETVRLLAAVSAKNDVVAASSIADLKQWVARYRRWADNPADRPAWLSESRNAEELEFWNQQVLWLRLWSGQEVDGLAAAFAELETSGVVTGSDAERWKGWIALRSGDAAGARARLTPLAETDPFAAMGAGLASEIVGEADVAAGFYRSVRARMPSSLADAWCHARLVEMGKLTPDPIGEKLQAMAAAVPEVYDDLTRNPAARLLVRLEMPRTQYGFGERISATVRIRNVSPIALGLGPGKPVPSQLYALATVDSGVERSNLFIPEVLSIDRRLRLDRNEEFAATVWLEPGQSAWAVEQLRCDLLRIRWKLYHGFVSNAAGGVKADPLGAALETPAVVRLTTPSGAALSAVLRAAVGTPERDREANAAAAMVAQAIASDDPSVMLGGLAAARVIVNLVDVRDGFSIDHGSTVLAAAMERYRTGDSLTRAAILASLPTATLAPAMRDTQTAMLAIEDPSPLVQLLALVTRAADPGDPAIAKAKGSSDKVLATVAFFHGDRLRKRADDLIKRPRTTGNFYATLSASRQMAAPEDEEVSPLERQNRPEPVVQPDPSPAGGGQPVQPVPALPSPQSPAGTPSVPPPSSAPPR
ncbi:MAG: hypothetical protein LW650_03515 [Planctomycetaceae bacterium]|jgi:hypothetical protein|nr:hypothetical protein [Phycisphaerales bacterium]MCE2652580.1 hypothetical protein [Planctomycetaceae bacterium]